MHLFFKAFLFLFSLSLFTNPLYAKEDIEVNIKDASTVFEYHNTLDFEITLSEAPGKDFFGFIFGDTVDIYYSTYNDSALANEDFMPIKNQKITFKGSETSKIIHIDIINNTIYEEQEKMFVQISFKKDTFEDEYKEYKIKNKKATGIIEDDDIQTAQLNISIADKTITEKNKTTTLNFPVLLNHDAPSEGVTIDFYSSDATAIQGTDYSEVNSSIFIKEGEREGKISVQILGNTEFEKSKYFYLNLTSTSIGNIIDNKAIGTIDDDDPEHPFADLTLEIEDSSDPIAANENLTYTISAINKGDEDPSNVKVVLELPNKTVFKNIIGDGWNCEIDGSNVKCTYNSPLSKNNYPASYPDLQLNIITPPENSTLELTATIESNLRDPNQDNNKIIEKTQIFSPKTDISIALTSTPNPISVSSLLNYEIRIENLSNVSAKNLKVTDKLPENVTFVSIDDGNNGNTWSCSQGETIICDYIENQGVYPAKHSSTITLQVNAPAEEGTVTNSVSIETSTLDSDTSNNKATNNTNVQKNNETKGFVPFSKLLQFNLNGDMTLIGNANLGSNDNVLYNDQANMQYIDNDQNTGTNNSTFSTLTLNQNYKVKWAGLYWSGTISSAEQQATMGSILFSTPNNEYRRLDASKLNMARKSDTFFLYSAFLDVTDLVQTSGTYGVANMTLSTGQRSGGGYFGGWTILVIYEDPSNTLSYKNISVFNGFDYINKDNVQFPLDGFVTPLSGPLTASVAFFAGDGDPTVGGVAQMTKGKTNVFDYVGGDASNPKDNLLNGSIAKFGVPLDPNVVQTFGVDADIIDVSSFMVNDQSSTTFRFDVATPSGGVDWYTLSMFAFATNLTVPDISTFKKEAVMLDEQGNRIALTPSSPIYEDSELIYTLTFKNIGTEIAKDVKVFDNFEFNNLVDIFNLDTFDGSKIKLSYKNRNDWDNNAICGYDVLKKTVWCDVDTIDINDVYKMEFSVKVRDSLPNFIGKSLKNKAYINYKNATTGDYIIRVNNDDGAFGGESNEFDAGIIAAKRITGTFNIQRTNSIYNDLDFNLYTQIQGRDFNYDIVFYEENLSKENTVEGVPLKIELVNQLNGDILYTSYNYYPFIKEESQKTSRIKVLNQHDLNDVNASKNAIFKITYVSNKQGDILQHSCKDHQTYQNCFDEHRSLHPKTTTISSQDNFSIRPESYHVKISDKAQLLRDSDNQLNYSLALAAGYDYNLSVVASAYKTSSPAKGYFSNAIQTLLFKDKLSCPDQRSPSKRIQFNNGLFNTLHFTHTNVGKYLLKIQDAGWTGVDKSQGDCIPNDSTTSFRDYEKSGCDIIPVLHDMDLKFYPYEYNITNFKLDNLPNSGHNDFLYMNNLITTQNMSLNIYGDILAQEKGGAVTTNYSDGCAVEDINLTLHYQGENENGRFNNSITEVIPTSGGNNTTFTRYQYTPIHAGRPIEQTRAIKLNEKLSIPKNAFFEGNATTSLFYNINKPLNQTVNPVKVQLKEVHVESIPAQSKAEGMNPFIPEGIKVLDLNRTFYFTRVKPEESDYGITYGNSESTPLSIQIFCDHNSSWCREMIGNNGGNSKDGIWYTSVNHVDPIDGRITTLTDNTGRAATNLSPFIQGYMRTLQTTIQFNPNEKEVKTHITTNETSWLSYDPIHPNGHVSWHNTFRSTPPSEWSGVGKAGNIIGTKANNKNSNRVNW